MKLPQLDIIPLSRDWIETFGGYNHNFKINEAEFYDMKNMTSDDYPLLSSRRKRGERELTGNGTHTIQGMIEKDSLWYIDNNKLYHNGADTNITLQPQTSKRQLVSMGAKIIIFPDKFYVNTLNIGDHGYLGASITTDTSITFSHCNIDGTDIDILSAGSTAPEAPQNLEYWLDTSGTKAVLKQYSAVSSMWVSVTTTYIKISANGIGIPFAEGDGVTVSGISTDDEGLNDLNNTSIIWNKSDDYIVLIGLMANHTQPVVQDGSQPITVSRDIPDLDYVCESGNRLWGCRYGMQNGEIVNEIYASKLGEPQNWSVYAGVSTDSWRASIGTDGQWTGCINFLGHPLFFKENWLHTVYGSLPSNFGINQTQVRGVQNGCNKSLSIVDEKLFYKARDGVMALSGSLPVSINSQLGKESFSGAVGGSFESKYYISMKDRSDVYHLFVYDAEKNMWHKEDNTHATGFCACDGIFYMSTSDNKILEIVNPSAETESEVDFYVESGKIGLTTPDKKYLARMDIRMSLSLGSVIRISVQYDDSGRWDHVTTITGTRIDSYSIPVRPKRCDNMRLRIEGRGKMKIYSICKTMEQGSAK